ncbi:MAG: tandem-95 repeat protein, partial [Candidatus Zixiibacteriota bacterium]
PDSTIPPLRASDLPPLATFTDNGDGTGTFVYRPEYEDQGVYYTLFEAVDSVDTLLKGWELVEITVIDSNRYPVIWVEPDSSTYNVNEGGTKALKILGTDPDGSTPSLHMAEPLENATFIDSGSGTGSFVFTPDYSQGTDGYQVEFFAVDEFYPDTVLDVTPTHGILVWDRPEPPDFMSINDTSIVEGDTLDVHVVTTSQVDIPAIEVINSPANAAFEDSGNGRGWFHFEPDFTQGGAVYPVGFVATSRGLVDTEFVSVSVLDYGNHDPVLDSIGTRTVNEEEVLSFRIQANDIDGDAITLDTANVPQNAAFVDSGSGVGSFVFNPDWTQAGVYYVTFYAEDTPGAIDSEVVEITVTNVDQPPVLDSIRARTVAEGETLQFRVHATDLDSDSLVLNAAQVPENAVFVDSGNWAGSFTFTPNYYQAGVKTVFFTVSDLVSQDYEMVAITVTNVPQPPDIDIIPLQSVLEGDTLEFRIHATDPDGDPFVFTVEDNPANSSLTDSGNGAGSFLFTPSYLQSGIYQFPIYATDTTDRIDSAIVQIEVIEAGNQPPALAALPDSTEPAVGDTFILHVYATDPDGPSITLSVADEPWNSDFADSGTGGGTFTFAPDSIQADSTYRVSFVATDGSLADTQLVVMHVVSFIYGDVNADGHVDVGDVVVLVNYLYRGGPPPQPWVSGDTNCDGYVNVGDVVFLVNYLFRGGSPLGCH